MSEREAFLAAIREHADDDVHRLVFADWLDEHEETEYAEFIRLQCRLASFGMEDPRTDDLQTREKGLLSAHKQRWCEGLPEWFAKRAIFHRGFPSHFQLTVREVANLGAKSSEDVWIDGVVLKGKSSSAIAEMVRPGVLAGLRVLRCERFQLGDGDVERLAECPDLAALRYLDVANNALDVESGRALASSPHLSQLRRLVIGYAANSGVLSEIANSPTLSHLRHLEAIDSGLSVEDVVSLAESPNVNNLQFLDVSWNDLGLEGITALANSAQLGQLRSLGVSEGEFGYAGLEVLVDSKLLGQLEFLKLGRNRDLGDAAAELLAASEHSNELVELDLSFCGIGDRGVIALARSPNLRGLKWLNLAQNNISAVGMEALAQRERFTTLEWLSMAKNPIGDNGGRAILDSPFLLEQSKLLITDCQVSPAIRKQLRARMGENVIC